MTPKKETSASPRVYRQLKIDKAKLKRALMRTSENLAKSGGGGDNGGMDAWQESVESRLNNLHQDIRSLGDKIDRVFITLAMGGLGAVGLLLAVMSKGFGWL